MNGHKLPPIQVIPKPTVPIKLVLPPTEDRVHKYFTLTNGLEVIVVSDPKAEKAAASMSIGVGYMMDPVDLPGCAHFCEHLMFMGSEKYPGENEYQEYLSSHNGNSNAFTEAMATTYFFDVSSDALEGAFERFAAIFVKPLFKKDCTEREINAIDSEHKKNLQKDGRRFIQLEKYLAKVDHPYRKFGTGNYETLWSEPLRQGRDPRQELINWWKREYCAQRMKLSLIGKQDVETLEKWVKERLGDLPVRTAGKPQLGNDAVNITFDENPMSENQIGYFTFVKPVKTMRFITFSFPFPSLHHLYQCKPAFILRFFLHHEGRGSILSYLKRQGWANWCVADCTHDALGFLIFKFTIGLTLSGLDRYREVTHLVFKYIRLLRTQPFSTSRFEEMKAIKDISFRFSERGGNNGYALDLSTSLQLPVPREKIISCTSIYEEYKEEELISAIELLKPNSVAIMIGCEELPKDVEGSFDENEPTYGTQYKRISFDDQFKKAIMAEGPINEVALPGPNPFIPSNFNVQRFEVKEPAKRPVLLEDSPISRLWYKRDDRFWLPKTNLIIKLHSPILKATPRNSVLSVLLCELFMDSITEDIYDASMAMLNFHLTVNNDRIDISASGFTDKLAELTEAMMRKFVEFKIDSKRFENIVEDRRISWQNFSLKDPFRMAEFWNAYVFLPNAWTAEEKLRELKYISPQDVEAFGKELIKRIHIETLVHGNASSDEARDIQSMLAVILQSRQLASAEKNASRSLILPQCSEYIWQIPISNESEINNAVMYEVCVGERVDIPLRCSLDIFAQIVDEPCFDTLRTKEQLGYVVFSGATLSTGIMGFSITVQSERDPQHIENRIEVFLKSMKDKIENMSDEEFCEHRQTVIENRSEEPKNLVQETGRIWRKISDGFYEFACRENDITELRKTTKENVLDAFNTYINPSASTRAKLSVHMKSQRKDVMKTRSGISQEDREGNQEVDAKVQPSNVWIEDIHKFKARLLLGRAPSALESFVIDSEKVIT
ncbi:hypothetical protein L204_100332 [Cryptococcus depauperatus]